VGAPDGAARSSPTRTAAGPWAGFVATYGHVGRDGVVRDLPPTGLGLGMLPGLSYDVGTAVLGPGEILVLYTDGVTESRNSKGEEFGAERLADIVRSEREKDAPAIVDAVFHGLTEFAGCGDPYDDRTLVVVKRAPATPET
jgi:sigma-B regulation protein RsbU (phosphoserine phosphatase)